MTLTEQYEIIVIEDSPSDALFTRIALEELNENLRVAWLQDGEEALNFFFPQGRALEKNDYQTIRIVLLDLNLPRFNGLEVLQELQKNPSTAPIPVVIFSSSELKSGIEECLQAGAIDYVVKSINFDDYTATIRRVVEPHLVN